MAEAGAPLEVAQEPQAYQWPNRKEDYELLDVIGQCVHGRSTGVYSTKCTCMCTCIYMVWLMCSSCVYYACVSV